MHRRKLLVESCVSLGSLLLASRLSSAKYLPASIHVEGVPPIPSKLKHTHDLYGFYGEFSFQGWMAGTRRILYLSQAGHTMQVFLGCDSGEQDRQLTHLVDTTSSVYPDPCRERLVLAMNDGGNENDGLFLFDIPTGKYHCFANGRWRNQAPLWSPSGRLLALSSNARNGKDQDLYVINPPYTSTGRRLMTTTGTCFAQDWSPDEQRIAALDWRRDAKTPQVCLIDLKTQQIETLPQPRENLIQRNEITWSRDGGSLYWLTNCNAQFFRLARYDLDTRRETLLTGEIPWDVESYVISDDGKAAVLLINEDGRSRLRVIDPKTGQEEPTPQLADGLCSGVSFRRHSREFAFEWRCPQSPTGIYSYALVQSQSEH